MSLLLAKLWPYFAIIGLGLSGGWYLGSAHWKGEYEALQAQDWKGMAQAEGVAKTALATQLTILQGQIQHNQDAMQRLSDENAQTLQNRDANLARVHRLEQLLSAQAARTPGHSVPETGSGPSAPPAGADAGPSEIEGLLIAAAEESERNAHQLDTLIAEVKPQL